MLALSAFRGRDHLRRIEIASDCIESPNSFEIINVSRLIIFFLDALMEIGQPVGLKVLSLAFESRR